MKLKIIWIITFAFAIAGCATTGRIQRSDSSYAKIAECGANIAIMIYADITLQVRLQNDRREGELSKELAALVENRSNEHPSAEYLKVIVSDIGVSGLRDAVNSARAGVANMLASAKHKYGDDRVQVLDEVIPRLESAAQSTCMSAGYQFSSIRRVLPPGHLPKDDSQPTGNAVQEAAALQLYEEIQQGEETKLKSEERHRDTAKRNEQELRDQETAQHLEREERARLKGEEQQRDATKRKERELRDQGDAQRLEQERKAKQKDDADLREAAGKKKAGAMVKEATEQERRSIISAIDRSLFDSESAKYRKIYLIHNSFACVEVNAKNRFGGYTGFQNVVATYLEGRWFALRSLGEIPISCLDLIAELHMQKEGN